MLSPIYRSYQEPQCLPTLQEETFRREGVMTGLLKLDLDWIRIHIFPISQSSHGYLNPLLEFFFDRLLIRKHQQSTLITFNIQFRSFLLVSKTGFYLLTWHQQKKSKLYIHELYRLFCPRGLFRTSHYIFRIVCSKAVSYA